MSSHESRPDLSHTTSPLPSPQITSVPVDTRGAREHVLLPHDISLCGWETSNFGPEDPREALKTYEESFDRMRCIKRSIYHAGIVIKWP